MVAIYTTTPSRVHAEQLVGPNIEQLAKWSGGDIIEHADGSLSLAVPRIGGSLRLHNGDWLLRDRTGKFQRMIDSEFRERYHLTGERSLSENSVISMVNQPPSTPPQAEVIRIPRRIW